VSDDQALLAQAGLKAAPPSEARIDVAPATEVA
jgi:hypothetical protein